MASLEPPLLLLLLLLVLLLLLLPDFFSLRSIRHVTLPNLKVRSPTRPARLTVNEIGFANPV